MPPVQIATLDQCLVLLAWLNRKFGYEHNRDLKPELVASGGDSQFRGDSV